jgi:hypothetical protein
LASAKSEAYLTVTAVSDYLVTSGLSATPSKIIVAFNLIASASRFRLWTRS